MEYEITIGLEIHCELKTATKLFCSCPNAFGGEANERCCPVCAGFPGALPVLNEKAVDYAVMAGLALGCEISAFSKWDRKNYYYPDLPKAWQTTQYDLPLCKNGLVEFNANGIKKSVRIERIHLEEDAGKLIHKDGKTLVDYNRCGVPLIEIVTKPDLHSPEDVVAFLEELKSILKFSGVSDVKMQEGSLRCDVNLSVAPVGEKMGTRTETKNLNSFRAVLHSCRWEANRQIQLLEKGEKVLQETRRWEDREGVGYSMRSKEDAHDYRYFPEPDLMPVVLSNQKIERLRSLIPPLKSELIEKYVEEYALPNSDAAVLTCDPYIAQLFEKTVQKGISPKRVANFIMTDVLRLAKEQNSEEISIKITADQLYQSLKAIEDGVVSLATFQKEVFPKLWNSDQNPIDLIDKLGYRQSSNIDEIEELVKDVISRNEKAINEYHNGNDKVFSFLLGQIMKLSKGKANPAIAREVLLKNLND